MSITIERAPELAPFALLSGPNAAAFSTWVRNRFADGESRPEWCFVARGPTGIVLARFGVWSSAHEPEVGHLFGVRFESSFTANRQTAFLDACIADVYDDGLRRLESRVYSSQAAHEQLRGCLAAAGFIEHQQKLRMERTTDGSHPVETRLRFEAAESVGRAAFVDAIERVTTGTLDRLDRSEVEDLGSRAAAELTFDVLSDIHRASEWWELAFDDRGDLVGLVVPQVLDPGVGVINYIGVVPEQRGRGFVHDLLARGTWRASTGTERVVAETDEQNTPMLAALTRRGYDEASRMWLLARD